jgi:hypothetical protein
MHLALPNQQSSESKSEIKKYELEDLINKLKTKIRSDDFFSLLKGILPQDLSPFSSQKRDITGEIINWNDFDKEVMEPDFGIEESSKYIQNLEIKGNRNDDRLKLFIEHLSYSFRQANYSFKKEYFTSLIITKTFGVHFSDKLFSQYIFNSKSERVVETICIDDLIKDYEWAKCFFSDEVKEEVLSKIKQVLVENSADTLTPVDYSYNNNLYQKRKDHAQDLLDSGDQDIFTEDIKQQIDYKCATNLIFSKGRLKFSEYTANECSNLEDIFSQYSIDKEQQHDIVTEYITKEEIRLTENKTPQNKKENDFTSDIGEELIQKFHEIATPDDIKLLTDKLKIYKIKQSILVEFESYKEEDSSLVDFISNLNLNMTIVNFDDDLLNKISTTSPGLVSLFKKFKINDIDSLEATKKILGPEIFYYAVTIPEYRIDFELADVLKFKKYGLKGWQINNICYGTRGAKFESESEEAKNILTLLTDGGDTRWKDFKNENIATNPYLGYLKGVTTINQEYLNELGDEMSSLEYEIENIDSASISGNNENGVDDQYREYEDDYFQNSGEERKHNLDVQLMDKKYTLDEYDRVFELYKQENKNDLGFRNLFEVFGYKEMMTYSTNKDITPHDALFCFNEILHLYGQSGLSSQEFYNNILAEIKADTASYDSGSGHHLLNSIAQSLKSEYTSHMEQTLAGYKAIFPESTLVSMQDVFASWSNLKKFYDLFQSQSELIALAEIKKNGSEKQLKYAQELLFHKGSKVSANEVIRFISNPDSFFDTSDAHSNSELHNNKKPSNYCDIPHLPLTAEGLRDAIIEGSLDQIQVFRPLEVEYSIPKSDVKPPTFEEDLSRALGSRQKSLQPEAKNIKDLNRNLRSVLEKNGYTFEKFTDFMETLTGIISGNEKITSELQEQLEKCLYSKQNGIPKFEPEKTTFIAKVNLKSDPNGVLAGDDTACCMPFGSGKNNIYTANPNCGMFTIQVKQTDGTLRTIAQSVLTKDYQTQETIPQLMSIISSGDLDKVSDMTEKSNLVLSCDNIELNPNWNGYDSQEKIRKIYQDFFKEYLDRFSELDNLDPNKIIIGQGYTDLTMNVPKVPNKFLPLAPVAYSDKTHDTVLSLAVDSSEVPKNQKKSQMNEYEKKVDLEIATPGISYATFEDTLAISYIETTKAYTDNQDSITGLHNMENGLIAKDIYNAHKDRPNMSIKYADKGGKVRGYLLAYEGKKDEEFPEYEDFLYVSDLATDKTSRVPGGRLIQGFVELYEKNYLNNDNMIPIRSQSRETSSYAIIQNQLSQLGDKLGVKFELIENGFIERNGEKFFQTMIVPRRVEENI